MSQPATLGELIRERRLAHGMSLSQFAGKIGVSTAEARRWERGESEPIPVARASLGDILELDPDVLNAAWPVPSVPDGDVTGPVGPGPEEASPQPRMEDTYLAAGGVVAAAALGAARETGDGFTSPAALETNGDTDDGPAALVLPEEPTQAIGAPFVVAPPVAAEAAMLTLVEPEKPSRWNPLRYIYDPNRPWLYYIRAVLTLAVLAVLAVVLFKTLGLLLDTLSELLDTISTESDQIESTIEAGGVNLAP